ncbi:MAG: twin-arginine translocase TatA/TatE family subunit [Pseudomonadota bacterium]
MGISVWQLLIILAIVLVLFGAKRIRNLGGDLGEAVKGFRSAVKDETEDTGEKKAEEDPEKLEKSGDDEEVIEGEATRENETDRNKG